MCAFCWLAFILALLKAANAEHGNDDEAVSKRAVRYQKPLRSEGCHHNRVDMSFTLPHVMQQADMQEDENVNLAPLIVVGDTAPTLSTLLAKRKSNTTACDSLAIDTCKIR